MTADALLTALLIFGLRVFNNALGTVRVVLITRDRRFLAAVLAFIEALTFAVVFSNVIRDLNNLPNLIAYCLGFSVGGWLGMALEARYVTSYVSVTVITRGPGKAIADALRSSGFGVTSTTGEGRDGEVDILRSVCARRDTNRLVDTIQGLDPRAFISMEDAKAVERGWLGPGGLTR